MTIHRRQFLRLATAGAIASLTSTACAGEDAADAATVAQPALLGILGADLVRELGVRYRKITPAENGADALVAALSGGGRQKLMFPWPHRRTVPQQIRDDFANGRTVLVNGWVLSVTEARQCALFSLIPA
ncbi:MAG: hypothetical protein PVSMB1_02170 [Gemmatimonadaceae bacterium]